tara:strand:+ start:457 stop:951 length:495 start_codon:yes stop_codon:yes gene_type:complete
MKLPLISSMTKHPSFLKTPVTPLLGMAALLAACAGKGDLVACPQVTTPLDTVNGYQLSDESSAAVDMRFNGVSAVCEVLDNGDIRMDLAIGIKLKRLEKNNLDDTVSIHIATAVVDADDKVVGNDRIVYKTGIQADLALKYPVIGYRVKVKTDQRLVIGLLPAP